MHLSSRTGRIYVAGHRGLVGSAIERRLRANGYGNLITRSMEELDLTVQEDVNSFFVAENPEFVVLAAAKVGGILANDTYPADFISENLAIQTNVIRAAHKHGVKRLVFLGSSCIYPREAPQPIKEEYLLTGPLEPTNQWYAIAKIAGVKLCQAYRKQYSDDFISLMPTNLFGPGDNFNLNTSHVLPALIRKFHEAKGSPGVPVTVWGSGSPKREFLYVDDLADACVFCLCKEELEIHDAAPDGLLNIGMGEDLSINDLALLVRDAVGCSSDIVFDKSKPDGTPRKLLDVSRMRSLGWQARTSLESGIKTTYEWYLNTVVGSVVQAI